MTISSLRRVLAFALMLWCAGTGCLVNGMATRGGVEPAASTDSSNGNSGRQTPTTRGHACCKARHRGLRNDSTKKLNGDGVSSFKLPAESDPARMSNCCPLTSGSFVTVSRSQPNDHQSSVLTPTTAQPPSRRAAFFTEHEILWRLPHHKHTYLSCCALLI